MHSCQQRKSHNSTKLVWVQNPEWVSVSPCIQHPAIASCISIFFFWCQLVFLLFSTVKYFPKVELYLDNNLQPQKPILLFMTPVCLILCHRERLATKLFPFCISKLKWFVSLQLSQVDGGGIDGAAELVWNVYMFGAVFSLIINCLALL